MMDSGYGNTTLIQQLIIKNGLLFNSSWTVLETSILDDFVSGVSLIEATADFFVANKSLVLHDIQEFCNRVAYVLNIYEDNWLNIRYYYFKKVEWKLQLQFAINAQYRGEMELENETTTTSVKTKKLISKILQQFLAEYHFSVERAQIFPDDC